MATHNYTVMIDWEPGSDFCAIFPDFPGCVSAGATLEEAIQNAREAIAGHIALMVKDGDMLPEPTPYEQVRSGRDATTVGVVLIPIALPGKPESVTVTLDDALLGEIDAAGLNRSQFLAEAARAELARRRVQ